MSAFELMIRILRRAILSVAILAAALAAGVQGPVAADALTEGRFREDVVSAVRVLRPGTEIVLAPDPAQIRVGPRTIDLTNLNADLKDRPLSERRDRIGAFLTGLLGSGKGQPCCGSHDYAAVARRLRVQLVPHQIVRDHPELVRRPFSDTLNVVYVLDEAERYLYVTQDMLDAWGAERAQVEAVAIANLADASKDVPAQLVMAEGRPAYLLTNAGDDYDAARLLVPRFLEGLREVLKADAIVLAAPTRNLLMAWPQDSGDRAAFAATVTALMKEGPYGRSDELFHFDAQGLRPLNATERAGHRP